MPRQILTLLLLIGSFTLPAQNHLISYTHLETVDKDGLMAEVKKNKIPKSLVDIHYSVDIYDIDYWTQWHDGTKIKASGLYYVPKDYDEAMAQVVYHHGTSVKRQRGAMGFNGEGRLCVGMAVDGYAVLFPDYIGLGRGEKFHLYQHAESEGQASVDMLFAIQELDSILGLKKTEQLFLTGYSQGGHATLATNQMIQAQFADDFTVTASSPMSGAYDMDGAQSTVLFMEYTQPHYLPYVLKGYNEVYKIVPYDYWNAFVEPYDTMVRMMFASGEHSVGQINDALPSVPKNMFKQQLFDEYVNNPEFPLRKRLQENSFLNWKPENPVQICYCRDDEEVMAQNAKNAYKSMKKLGAEHVRLKRAGKKFRHGKCAVPSFLYTKMYFDSFRKGSEKGRKGPIWNRFLITIGKRFLRK